MLRVLHTADVHLGARHADLGDAAVAQRERQFAAFVRTIDLALAEAVDVVLVAGDLFDSNVQPRRSVERVAAELRRLVAGRIRTVITPGTHDVYDRASVYRAYDLPALAAPRDDGMVTVLTPERPSTYLATCDVSVVGRPFPTKRAPFGPLRDPGIGDALPGRWKVGLFHAAVGIPGRTDGDDVVVRPEEIAASGLDYVALGHWHSSQTGRSGGVTWAYSGAPEPVAVDQDRAGNVLLVTLDERDGRRTVEVEERRVGRTRFERIDVDAAAIPSQPALIERLLAAADADVVLDVRLIGVRPDELDLHLDEVEAAVHPSFLRVRVRDASRPPLTDGPLPGPDTIAGAFIRDLERRIAMLETTGGAGGGEEAGELRDALRLGRLLLAGHEVTL
jgi:DNA repair exonuclease SbcCD nuclease subunit